MSFRTAVDPPVFLTPRPAPVTLMPMAVKTIQLGQVWRHDQSARNFLVTKLYSEVFAQYAMLRPADSTAAQTESIRVKVLKGTEGASLPGYTFTQESQDF